MQQSLLVFGCFIQAESELRQIAHCFCWTMIEVLLTFPMNHFLPAKKTSNYWKNWDLTSLSFWYYCNFLQLLRAAVIFLAQAILTTNYLSISGRFQSIPKEISKEWWRMISIDAKEGNSCTFPAQAISFLWGLSFTVQLSLKALTSYMTRCSFQGRNIGWSLDNDGGLAWIT